MDPDANLYEQRRISKLFIDGGDLTTEQWMTLANRLADLVEALDVWIRDGGFLPTSWNQHGGTR